MSNPITLGRYYSTARMDRAIKRTWSRDAWALHDYLDEKGHDLSRSVFELPTKEIMDQTGIKRRESLQAAFDILEKCNTVSVEVLYGKQRGIRKISLLQPGTGLVYPKVSTRKEYRDGYDLVEAVGPAFTTKLPIADQQDIPEELFQRVYEEFVPGITFRDSGDWWMTNCPFHDDNNPSAAIHRETGYFYCHAGCLHGNIIEVVQRIKGWSYKEARAAIHKIMGIELSLARKDDGSVVDLDEYIYHNMRGIPVLKVIRRLVDEEKTFPVSHLATDGKSWIPGLGGKRRLLYNLHTFVAAEVICISEGEKNANDLAAQCLVSANGSPVATTCNLGGAGRWPSSCAPLFANKKVLLFRDNDAPGFKHADMVYASLLPVVGKENIRLVHLYPSYKQSPEHHKKDVSDYLHEHTAGDLLNLSGRDWIHGTCQRL